MNTSSTNIITTIMPYIASVICALISGVVTYLVSRKQTKSEIQKLEKQHQLDIEKEREKHIMELEKIEMQHKYEMELKDKEMANQIGGNALNSIISSVMDTPEVKQEIAKSVKTSNNKSTKGKKKKK